MKKKYYGRRATKEEMKGRIFGTKDVSVGDIIIGRVSRCFYEVIEIMDEDYMATINLSKEGRYSNSCVKKGHYELFDYKSEVLSMAENW